MRTHKRTLRRGAAIMEASLVLPVFLLFLLGTLEYCRYVMMLQVVTNAAREGVRYAISHTDPITLSGTTSGNATSDVTKVVSNALAGQALSGQSVQVYQSDSLGNNIGTWTDTNAGGWICVKITGNFSFISYKLLNATSTVPVTATAVARVESD